MDDSRSQYDSDREWVIAYYDLLGITEQMREWDNPGETCRKIGLFRKTIMQELLSAIDHSMNMRNEQNPELTPTIECNFIAFGFADTMVIASPLINRHGLPQLMALSMLIMGMIPLSAELLAEGIIFRAGIDVGVARVIPHIGDYFNTTMPPGQRPDNRRISEGDIAGPTYITAYELASMKSSPPGVYVGTSAIGLIQDAAKGTGKLNGWEAHAHQTMSWLMRLNSKNDYAEDGKGDKYAVDFANICGHSEVDITKPGHRETQDQFQTGYQWIRHELANKRNVYNCQKLHWLKAYLERRIPDIADGTMQKG